MPTLNAILELDRRLCSFINSLNTNEDYDALDEFPDDADTITDDDEVNLTCEINLNVDNFVKRLCETKAFHDAVLGKIDVSLVGKTLKAMEARQLDTKYLIAKLDDVAKTVDLDFSTILAEQMRDQILWTF